RPADPAGGQRADGGLLDCQGERLGGHQDECLVRRRAAGGAADGDLRADHRIGTRRAVLPVAFGAMSTRYPLARRTAQIDPFHVMELTKRAAALEAAGHPVIHLNIGEPDFTAPEPVVTALERAVRAG